jgi:hypothetical protein
MSRQGTKLSKNGEKVTADAVVVPRLDTARGLAREVLAEVDPVAKAVQESTGWSIDLKQVQFVFVSAIELARRYVVDRERCSGVPCALPTTTAARAAFNAMRDTRLRETVALFVRSERAILLNEDVLSTVSKDTARSALFHELVHVAQFQCYPDFWIAADALVREAISLSRHGGDLPKDELQSRLHVAQDRMQARKALLEGHAAVLQADYIKTNDLHPAKSVNFFELVSGEAALLTAGSSTKVAQFVAGALVIRELQDRHAAAIEALFQNPALVDMVFGSKNPVSAKGSPARGLDSRPSA